MLNHADLDHLFKLLHRIPYYKHTVIYSSLPLHTNKLFSIFHYYRWYGIVNMFDRVLGSLSQLHLVRQILMS